MRGPRLTLDPYTSPMLALLTVASDHAQSVVELEDRARARGYACAAQQPHGLLKRLETFGFLARLDGKRYTVTPNGRLYREACAAQLPAYVLRVFSCLSAVPCAGPAVARYGLHQGWGTRMEIWNALNVLCADELAERAGRKPRLTFQLTPLGVFTQNEVAPAFQYLGLTPTPVPDEFRLEAVAPPARS